MKLRRKKVKQERETHLCYCFISFLFLYSFLFLLSSAVNLVIKWAFSISLYFFFITNLLALKKNKRFLAGLWPGNNLEGAVNLGYAVAVGCFAQQVIESDWLGQKGIAGLWPGNNP